MFTFIKPFINTEENIHGTSGGSRGRNYWMAEQIVLDNLRNWNSDVVDGISGGHELGLPETQTEEVKYF